MYHTPPPTSHPPPPTQKERRIKIQYDNRVMRNAVAEEIKVKKNACTYNCLDALN
jgi:hypothetical protein